MQVSEIAYHRLASQALLGTKIKTPAELVGWMLAMQGQDFAGAKWSVGVRLPGSTEADIEQAFAGRSILRTWIMRGTLQLVAPEDIHWLLDLLGPKVIAGNQRRYRELELDERTLQRSNDLLAAALEGGKILSRKDLLGMLQKKRISTEGQRGVYMLQRASLDRLICQCGAKANVPFFISLEGIPNRAKDREESLADLARRYFISRGPATLADFTWWTGLPVAQVRAALDSVRSELARFTIDGSEYWWSGKKTANAKKAAAFLLPTFDEVLIAYKDRSIFLGERKFAQLSPGGGMLPGTILLDGKVRGIWKRTIKKDKVEILLQPYEPLSTTEMGRVKTAAEEFGRFLGLDISSDQ